MNHIWLYVQANWGTWLGWAIVTETSIKSVAEKKGNIKIVNICDHIGDFLGFISDVVMVLFKKQPPTPPPASTAQRTGV